MLVAGARPNFMKIAPIIRACEKRPERFEYVLVHTGQHYDDGMSDVFFRELEIPRPNYFLDVGSAGHSEQTAKIMTRFDPVLLQEQPDCVVVVGDVNSTLACAIVAKKLNFKVAHVEAGLRSGDMRMPEEINRLVTDAISDYFFTTEESASDNLKREGHAEEKIFFVGHVMIDNLFHELDRIGTATLNSSIDSSYGVVTLHRPSNVDSKLHLSNIVTALNSIAESTPLVFPIHPRTKSKLSEFELILSERIRVSDPMSYQEFLDLWRNATVVLTDSGGLQEETTALGVPCLTLRENTERPITVSMGTNQLVGSDPNEIISAANTIISRKSHKQCKRPPLWDGKASVRILDALESV